MVHLLATSPGLQAQAFGASRPSFAGKGGSPYANLLGGGTADVFTAQAPDTQKSTLAHRILPSLFG